MHYKPGPRPEKKMGLEDLLSFIANPSSFSALRFDIAQNPKLKRYGVEACRLRFMNKLDPALSHRPWSDYEIDRLRELLLEHGLHDWETVSQELPGRSAMDCCGQYRKTMSSVGIAMKGHVEETTDFTRFSPEEVVKLVHGWLVCGGVMPLVCQFLPHRTASQCYKYLKNNLNFNAERTPFTDAELKFIQQFGRQTKTAGNFAKFEQTDSLTSSKSRCTSKSSVGCFFKIQIN
jgi:hypothetical protein